MTATREHSFLPARNIKQIKDFDVKDFNDLRQIGIALDGINGGILEQMMSSKTLLNCMAMDAIQPTITTASIGTPIQFLQNWLPGFVFVITGARKIDDIVGISTSGSWEDEQIVQGILERVGTSVPYGDYTNVPLSSWNVNFNYRTVVRFEEGMKVGREEEARAARMRVDTASMKRESSALALEIIRNTVGFLGYNSGNNNTYGFLNDPGLPNYVTVATGASSSTLWSTKTFLEICRDIRTGLVALRTNSQDTIDPKTTPITLAVATNSVDWMSVTSDFGISVQDWLNKAYPNVRVVSAPQLNSANGGANVFYLFAERVDDMSSDDGRTFIQVVPTKFMVLGVQQLAKGYEEDYSNATAGVMCKRPYAVVRYSGI
jgi:hypothetical protein